MTSDISRLATTLNDSMQATGRTTAAPWLFRSLLELLATGAPVELETLATVTGRSIEEIRDAVAAAPDTEYDDQGRIVGYGLTLRETAHRFEINGRELYTWCALDTLIFPEVLGRAARVESPCHSTGTPVRVTIDPTAGVTNIQPAGAVVSIVIPSEMSSVRSAFCDQVHFFASADAATTWLDAHPGMFVVPVADAFQLGRPLSETLLGGTRPTDCC